MKLKMTIRKAEGTARGQGWYWLANGIVAGHEYQDYGGEDWFSSEREARLAAAEWIATKKESET